MIDIIKTALVLIDVQQGFDDSTWGNRNNPQAADATATFDRIDHDGKTYTAEEIHAISLANLHQEFGHCLMAGCF